MGNVKAWSVFAFILLVACGRPSKLPVESNDLASEGVTPGFDLILQKIIQPKCVACHASFATYTGLMTAVVPKNPDASSLYTKTASGQMPKNGTPLSDGEVKTIYDWISAGAPTVTTGTPPPGVTVGAPNLPDPIVTPAAPGSNAISPTFAWIQANVLTPRCIVCHRGASAPAGYDLSSYDLTMAGGRILAGNPTGSRLFQRIDNNSMPPGGPALSAEVKAAIRTWIQNGGLNDAPAGGLPPGATPPAPPPLPPLEPKFASINANIFGPRCLSCHNNTTARKGVNLQTYAGVMREVRAGNAGSSKLFEVINDNEMPASGGPLNFTQKETIRQWINMGALNN